MGPYYKSYEVTQLILSIYGMLLVPFEKYKKNSTVTKKETIEALSMTFNYRSLEEIIAFLKRQNRLKSTYRDSKDGPVFSFIHHLRNSVAHERMLFCPTAAYDSDQISEIVFYDFEYSEDSKTFETAKAKFCTIVTVSELRRIIGLIMDMYSHISPRFDSEDLRCYEKEMAACESFLSGNNPNVNGRR